jgi:hypothetical protein
LTGQVCTSLPNWLTASDVYDSLTPGLPGG